MDAALLFEWLAFSVLAIVAIAGALGMTTTMSMFRSGIFLMASFVGVAGLFVLLGADLLGLLQVMMYVGGMLVMILFMVLFSNDPGGSMMASHMNLRGFERLFSRGLARRKDSSATESQNDESHGEGGEEAEPQEGGGGGGGGHGDMSMFTTIKRGAAAFSAAAGLVLVALLIVDRPWQASAAEPAYPSAARVGHLLMGKYMIAFEGAGLLILLGIFGAVYLQRPAPHPDPSARERLSAAVDEPPVGVEREPLRPLAPIRREDSAQEAAE